MERHVADKCTYHSRDGVIKMSRIHQDNPLVDHRLPIEGIKPNRSPIGRHPSETMFRRTLTAGQRLRVCVVGAGISGLRATDILTQHGAQVTVMEARNRIGGRVGQTKLAGNLVDLYVCL